MSSEAAIDHATVSLQLTSFALQVQHVCSHLYHRSLADDGKITVDAWTETVGLADDLTKG